MSGDSIKVKLLQDVKAQAEPKSASSNRATYTKASYSKGFQKKAPKCYNCGKIGHYKKDCRSKKSYYAQTEKKTDKNTKKGDTAFLVYSTTEKVNKNARYLDSCASTYLTMNRDWLNENAINTEAKIKIANNSDPNIVSKGTATINVVVEDERKLIPANKVMYAPDAAVNLLSISKIVRNGHKVIFYNTGAKIINSMDKTVATGSETNGIYQLDTEPIENKVYSCVGQTSSNLWHRRLGHVNRKSMNLLVHMSTGLDKNLTTSEPCIPCIEAKHSRYRNIENNIVGKDIGTTKKISAVLPIENEDEEEQDQENDGLPDEQTNNNFDDSNQDINGGNNETIEIEEPRITRTGREVPKPKHFDDYEIYAAYDVLESENDQQTYKEAYKSKEWQQAIQSELMSHDKLKTWSITDLPDGKSPIDTRWVFRTKEDGTKKARSVAKGFQLQEENPLTTMYAPVTRMSTVRTLLVHALQQNWDLRQLDIPTAFLNGKVETEVYIKIPDGVNIDESKVLKLDRALYGLKESPRCWIDKFNEIMTDLHFRRSKFDFCLYTKVSSSE
ncbi:hypothetical protein JTB14_015760 [Gonioctena quinquepunctata]|nr:hypothetical protein JTB14_015760 [Gonioctena quinquepunctata]